MTAQKPCRRVFEGAVPGVPCFFFQISILLTPGAPVQLKRSLKCRRLSRHIIHLERRVEFICAEGYLSRCSRHLFQAQRSRTSLKGGNCLIRPSHQGGEGNICVCVRVWLYVYVYARACEYVKKGRSLYPCTLCKMSGAVAGVLRSST